MPPKRERLSPFEDENAQSSSSSATPSPSKKRSKKPWTPAEEQRFDEALYQIAKTQMWQAVKGDELLSGRGANGIKAHLDTRFKNVKK